MRSGRMTRAVKDEKTAQAVSMSARGKTYKQIAAALDVSPNTASNLVRAGLAQKSEHRDNDRERAIVRYEAIIEAAWERFGNTDTRSLNSSAYLNSIRQAQERIDKLTGVETPAKLQITEQDEYEVVWEDADKAEIG